MFDVLYDNNNPLGFIRHVLFDDCHDVKTAPDAGPDYVKGLFHSGPDGVYHITPKDWMNDIVGDADARRGRDWMEVLWQCVVLSVAHYTRTDETAAAPIHDMVLAEVEYQRPDAQRVKRRYVRMQLPHKRWDLRYAVEIERYKHVATRGYTLVASFTLTELAVLDLVATTAVAADMADAYTPLSHVSVWHAVLVYGILRELSLQRSGGKGTRERLRRTPGVVRGVAIVDRRGVLLRDGVLDARFDGLNEPREEVERNLALNAREVGEGDLVERGMLAFEEKRCRELWPAIRDPPVVPRVLTRHEWRMEVLRTKIAAHQAVTDAYKAAQNSCEALREAYVGRNAALAAMNGALEGQLAARRAKSEALAAGNHTLAAEWAAREDEYAARVAAAPPEIAQLGEGCEALDAKCSTLKAAADALKAEADAKCQQCDALLEAYPVDVGLVPVSTAQVLGD